MTDPARVLRQAGLRVTQPRRAVLASLLEAGRHMTAEDVHRQVQRSLPGLRVQTVYAVLGDLVRAGALRELALGRGPAVFDPNTSRHHHLACRSCGRLTDVPCAVAGAEGPCLRPTTAPRGWQVERTELTFVGLCPECRAGTDGRPGERPGATASRWSRRR